MKVVFADSYFYFAMLNPSDRSHKEACSLAAERGWRIVTTEYAIIELLDGLSAPSLRARTAMFFRALAEDPATRIVPATPGIFEKALQLYEKRADKSWSFTDCVSFIVMRNEGITEALTGDAHFEQAGFLALLKSES